MKITVRKPNNKEIVAMQKNPVWSCEVKTFHWSYDSQETCLILEGEVTVTTETEEVSFGPGDLVIFPEGLDCTWNVIKPVRKHYQFG